MRIHPSAVHIAGEKDLSFRGSLATTGGTLALFTRPLTLNPFMENAMDLSIPHCVLRRGVLWGASGEHVTSADSGRSPRLPRVKLSLCSK